MRKKYLYFLSLNENQIDIKRENTNIPRSPVAENMTCITHESVQECMCIEDS